MVYMGKDKVLIYCSGSIQRGKEDTEKLLWTDKERKEVSSALNPIKVVFLNPDERTDDLNNHLTVFGRDHFQVSLADFIVVEARERRGVGVGIEMFAAKFFNKPVISVVPKNSHYRREKLEYLGSVSKNYIHAHIFGISDAIVDDFKQAGEWIKEFSENPKPVKDITILEKSIKEYKRTQLDRDKPMKEIIGKPNILK